MVDERLIKRDSFAPMGQAGEPLSGFAEDAVPEFDDARSESDALWSMLEPFDIQDNHLEAHRIITGTRRDPAHSAFDVLRTKLLQSLRENGWSRVAVTSPTEGCGKTFMSTNLALSLSRQTTSRSILMDFDMRRPSVAKVLGIDHAGSMGDLLRGYSAPEDHLRIPGENAFKIGANVAIGANDIREEYASELLQQPMTAEVLDDIEEEFLPDVMIFDMPPALVNDDVLAARPLYDGVLLVVGGGITKPQDIREVEQRLGTETPLLGIVLNRSESASSKHYGY